MSKKTVALSSYEFLKRFNTEFKTLKFLEKISWKNGIKCEYRQSKKIFKRNKKTGFLIQVDFSLYSNSLNEGTL